MTRIRTLQQAQALEERLQLVKWTVLLPPIRFARLKMKKYPHDGIVSQTAGLLGKRFPRGVTYERRMRQQWEERLRRVGL